MKITRVLTAVNNNPKYTRFIPIFVKFWKDTYPHIKITIVYIGGFIPAEYAEYSDLFVLFPEIPGISSVYIAQVIRIVYPALMGPSDTTVITDMDMLPGKNNYFVLKVDSLRRNAFVSLRPLSCVGKHEIAICYNVASTSTWRSIFEINTHEDVRAFLVKHYRPVDGIHGGVGWTQDQLILFKYISSYTGDVIILDDQLMNRLEPYIHNYDIQTFIRMSGDSNYSDIHLYSEDCMWTPDDIRFINAHVSK